MKKIILSLGAALILSSCGLNQNSDGELRATFMRGSRVAGVVPVNGLYLNNSVKKPSSAEWTSAFNIAGQSNLESFLEISQGALNKTYQGTDIFFWGQIPSEVSLDPKNVGTYVDYFKKVKKNNFKFEMEIWDEESGGLDENNKRIDLLGYAFFGRHGNSMSGDLYSAKYYESGSYEGTISLTFVDSSGLVALHGRIVEDTQRERNFQWRFMGRMDFENGVTSSVVEIGVL